MRRTRDMWRRNRRHEWVRSTVERVGGTKQLPDVDGCGNVLVKQLNQRFIVYHPV